MIVAYGVCDADSFEKNLYEPQLCCDIGMSMEWASSLNDKLSPRQRSSDSQVSCLFPSSVDM